MITGLLYRRVEIWALPLFQCDDCGAQATGTPSFAAELDVHTQYASDIAARLCNLHRHVTNHYMPVGWASFHPGLHRCPTCLNKEKP